MDTVTFAICQERFHTDGKTSVAKVILAPTDSILLVGVLPSTTVPSLKDNNGCANRDRAMRGSHFLETTS